MVTRGSLLECICDRQTYLPMVDSNHIGVQRIFSESQSKFIMPLQLR